MSHEFDFLELADEGDAPTWERTWNIGASTSGRMDGVVLWWEVDVDTKGEVRYSTEPKAEAVVSSLATSVDGDSGEV